jgi:hypothetical protein
MAVDLAAVRRKVLRGDYAVSFTHTEKLRERQIKAADIEEAVANGKIIEDYPDDLRGPSLLLFGMVNRRPLHIIFGNLDDDEILIVTAYEPNNKEEWEHDWTTRKKR